MTLRCRQLSNFGIPSVSRSEPEIFRSLYENGLPASRPMIPPRVFFSSCYTHSASWDRSFFPLE